MDFIISFLDQWGYSALFLFMVLENMNIPIPSEIILGFAGFLVSKNIFSFWPTIIVGTMAGLVGSVISYYIGKKGGRAVLLKYTEKGGLGARKMGAAKSWFDKYGGIAVFTGRLLPGIRTFISLPAGIAEYPMTRFILLTIIGTVPWTIFLVYMGALLGDNWILLLEYDIEIALACVALSLLFFAVFYYVRKKRGSA